MAVRLHLSIPSVPPIATGTSNRSPWAQSPRISKLTLQLTKQIWQSYPVLNINTLKWENRRNTVREPQTPIVNALGLDLGVVAESHVRPQAAV
ncbi:hypothetical protein M422DRAFT_36301 [Sphaerobolus stellatus SS14]|uniref:Uncharacterized protein n=1 Tax=Sphaerobolus stellatus (strain SS14) TaxID=990650 RepID=A0A0C9UTU6_SPHS4|nr:hypothetical protein M422DRAFT_37292 [Sphaerobolus stellatus SS14]KIJ31303.1 hypothetical protein M422DRAFT_36301 [Sphaerobolus stellatus SS14]